MFRTKIHKPCVVPSDRLVNSLMSYLNPFTTDSSIDDEHQDHTNNE